MLQGTTLNDNFSLNNVASSCTVMVLERYNFPTMQAIMAMKKIATACGNKELH